MSRDLHLNHWHFLCICLLVGSGSRFKIHLIIRGHVPGFHTVYWFRTETGSAERAREESSSSVSEHRLTSTPSPTACGRAEPVNNKQKHYTVSEHRLTSTPSPNAYGRAEPVRNGRNIARISCWTSILWTILRLPHWSTPLNEVSYELYLSHLLLVVWALDV